MGIRLDSKTVPVIANAVEQVLGLGHPLAQDVRDVLRDPSLAGEVWSRIDALPNVHRKAIAGLAAAAILPNLGHDGEA